VESRERQARPARSTRHRDRGRHGPRQRGQRLGDRDQGSDRTAEAEHAVAVARLPEHHQDPFDRLLIAQAQIEGLTIVTSDAAFDEYEVDVLDARS
jgi:predicted nucleic acid-binding protein